jgi:hypothetical protein
LSDLVDWLIAHGDHIITVLSSGFVLALLGLLARVARRAWQEVHGRGRVVLIRSSRSRWVGWIEDVQEKIFPPDECDPRGVLGRRIDRSKFGLLGHPHSDDATVAIVYVKGRTPVAYLSAEYFRDVGIIFFWYIVSLRDGAAREDLADLHLDWDEIASVREPISPKLIAKLLDVCSGKHPWNSVVAEVDVASIQRARQKVMSFQRAARTMIARILDHPIRRWRLLRRRVDPQAPRVFKVDIDFMMPLHDADLLDEAHKHESPGWLLFAPREPDRYLRDGRYEIGGAEVGDRLLATLLMRSYHDPDHPAYNVYIADFYAQLTRDLPERVPLVHNPNVMS